MPTQSPLRWGILGAGRIAAALARAINQSTTSKLVAIASRSAASAEAFGKQYNIPHRYDSYDAVLNDIDVDCVYISLPNHLHAPWTIKCAKAGKHILCEKPFAMNEAEARTMVDAARKHDVFLMEAFMYRCHPQTAKVVELLKQNAVGPVRLLAGTFSFAMSEQYLKLPDVRMYNAMGGGAIMDVGTYPVSMSRLIAGVLTGKPFADPVEVNGSAMILPVNQIDEVASASLRFAGPKGQSDIVASISCGMRADADRTYSIWGETGHIRISDPWLPHVGGRKITLQRTGSSKPETIVVDDGGVDLYTIDVDHVAAHIPQRQAPAMNWDDTLGNMRTLDRWRAAVGLKWECER